MMRKKPPQKKADSEYYKKFRNVNMINKLSGGLFDLAYMSRI